MSYVIFGRAIKNEYLTLATIGTVFGGVMLAKTAGGSSKPEPSKAKTLVEKVKEAVPISAGSSEEEQFIQKFLDEAEKADAK
ncbi:hypothetical protein C8J56DRAFT_936073 [Mycena floridula]|nr:hypothetical protein C8J56DRAFT_936073 [Mycena floridula]